jgi:hypothetical protein
MRNRAFIADKQLSKFMLLFYQDPLAFMQSSLLLITASKSKSGVNSGEEWHLKKVPLKKLTPMMENIRRSRVPTMSTFCIAPNVAKRALTMILRFSNLLITLRGLRARKALRALSAANCDPYPDIMRIKSRAEMLTTNASTLFHPESRYGLISPRLLKSIPLAIILVLASVIKQRVNTTLIYMMIFV